ncbi:MULTISPECIES: histidine kinase [Paenibacillus]|uniref:Two-component sensor histidine kinase n=1 Tax=Paenibacillus odorifer TaxID=189426 RepID=A0A1R0WXI3_9BACL|nr:MULTISPECIES: histidine kinase [Paenibacillus]ETT68382.1 integral membrane sensor signal transduction histidine kinase [Paenibacillus sp. FSL H8-237]OMD06885.1 two-component sensor histidine kinase [Paenibacillus odorifer]OMD23588.1 two-component sensor histidine kinase [Paenibacillus odorifer]OMD32364.1 two-component sensor histidine kinase [Paenibacillus odorifer]OME34661.1 two-component sensor histidine kinase [Paenibacillus odorifer]
MYRYNLFTKIVCIMVIMLIPITILYFYSNKTTTDVLRTELNTSNNNQLSFFLNQVESNMELLSSWPILLIHDPDILSLKDTYLEKGRLNLDTINLIKRIQTKISIQESSSNWKSKLYLYSPSIHRMVSENDAKLYEDEDLKREVKSGWHVEKIEGQEGDRFVFSWFSFTPFMSEFAPEKVKTVMKVEFDSRNIEDMLDKFKSDGRRDPFYYKQGTGLIFNRSADKVLAKELVDRLEETQLKPSENRTVKIEGESYSVNIVYSDKMGWYLIDYMPLTEILHPILTSNRLFYFAISALLLMSCLVAYLLYVQVQVPIRLLVGGFQRLKQGDYSARVEIKGKNEFSFLSGRFNSMVEQIQMLIENVLMEKIHVREARLKQLQSQINPHFFYNCFSFITSMAKLDNMGAVVGMSHNLSRYYRYTTRQERDLVALSEEVEFVNHYLEIQKMRMSRLRYEINIPPQMRKRELPPLVLQPLVENAVIHGIEPIAKEGLVRITGSCVGREMTLTVEDDGQGMTPEGIIELENKLSRAMDEEMGCGLWNVHQRMRLRFGETSGLRISPSPLGGLQVTLQWLLPNTDNEME